MKSYKKVSKTLLVGIGALGLISLLFTSCLKENDTPAPPTALLNVAQVSPDEQPLDFYLESKKVSPAPLNYEDGIDYFSAFAGERQATFNLQGTQTAVATAKITLLQNTAYSLFLANKPTSPEIVLYTDTINRPPSGQATLRFINLAPDAGAVDLAIHGGNKLVSNRTYKGFSSFAPITPGKTYSFDVKKAGTNTILATSHTGMLNSGYVYTVIFQGLSTPTNTTDSLSVHVTTNAYFY